MRTRRLLVVLCSLLLGACADAAEDEETTVLKDYLERGAAPTRPECERLNATFARLATRASGYRLAGVAAHDGLWSPIVSVDEDGASASDVSAWLDAQDITREGAFAPCKQVECLRVALSEQQRATLHPWLTDEVSEELAERLSGAVFRLVGARVEVRWVPELDVAIVLHSEEGFAEVNPRLLALVASAAGESSEQKSGVAEASLPSLVGGVEPSQEMPTQPLAEFRYPPARTHEPPEGHSNDSGGDCDCDCNLIEVKCSIDSRSPNAGTGTPLFFALTALTFFLRRRARARNSRWTRRLRAPLRWLLVAALGLIPERAAAQAAAPATQLEAGKAHLSRKDYASAIGEFEAARSRGAGSEVLEPLAKAYEGAGRLPEAYAVLGELLGNEAQLKNADRERLRRQAEALEPRLAFVNVQVQPPETVVFVDGQPAVVDPRSKQVIVTPGAHRVLGRASGFLDAEQTITAEAASRNAIVTLLLAPSTATLEVRAPGPDFYIAVDGVPVGRGHFRGPVAPGPHTVQIYRERAIPTDFRITALAGQVVQLPPPNASAQARVTATPSPKRVYKFRRGPYVVGHLGFAFLTARPTGFRYELRLDEDTNQQRESPGLSSMLGVNGGMRLSRGVGIGGLLMYGRGGGKGTVEQVELSSTGGTLSHEGPADFTQQFLRLGPHVRFMAGRDSARFLAGLTFGYVHSWVDLEHEHVVEQGGVLIEQGTFTHEDSGANPFWGFDLGAEFNVSNHLLLGFALDMMLERTTNISGNSFGGTAQAYVGFSARAGFHNWIPE